MHKLSKLPTISQITVLLYLYNTIIILLSNIEIINILINTTNLIYLLLLPKFAFLTYTTTELNSQLSILQMSCPTNKVFVLK